MDATSARPRIIDDLQSTCVIDIAAGDSHCLALSKGQYYIASPLQWRVNLLQFNSFYFAIM